MVSETTFARIYDLNPLTFPKLRNCRRIPKWNTVFIFFIDIGLTFSITRYYILNTKAVDIQSFVHTTDLFIDTGYILYSICTRC